MRVLVTCCSTSKATNFKPATTILLDTPQVCFARQVDSIDTRASKAKLIMAQHPKKQCAPPHKQRDGLHQIFHVLSTFSPSVRDQVKAGLLEAMYLVQHGADMATRRKGLSQSFLRYFHGKDLSIVRNVLLQLSVEAGLNQESDCQGNGKPLQKQFSPRLLIVPDESCEKGNIAYMDESGPLHPAAGKQHMGLCLQHIRKHIRQKSLTDISCDQIGTHLTDGGSFEQTMTYVVLHELLHWNIFQIWLPTRLSEQDVMLFGQADSKNSRNRIWDLPIDFPKRPHNETTKAYGPWAAQKLRRNHPRLAIYNVDNYVNFLVEEYFQYKCDPVKFEDTLNPFYHDRIEAFVRFFSWEWSPLHNFILVCIAVATVHQHLVMHYRLKQLQRLSCSEPKHPVDFDRLEEAQSAKG